MSKNAVINKIGFSNSIEKKVLISDIEKFMEEYGDPFEEANEVLEIASDKGLIYELLYDNERAGIAVLTETPFELFQPKYHLAYIAINRKFRGKNLGKMLLKKIEEDTKGSLALHVSPRNTKAIKFYQKMGWKVNYLRMMPK